MKLGSVDLRSIGPTSEKLRQNQISAGLPHCNLQCSRGQFKGKESDLGKMHFLTSVCSGPRTNNQQQAISISKKLFLWNIPKCIVLIHCTHCNSLLRIARMSFITCPELFFWILHLLHTLQNLKSNQDVHKFKYLILN